MNGTKYYMARSFLITMTGIVGAFALAYLMEDTSVATIIVPVATTAWFGGKVVKDIKRQPPQS